MSQIIELLADRNHHLERFYDLSEEKMTQFALGEFEEIEFFYSQREAILNLVKCIDDLIQNEIDTNDLNVEQKIAAIQLLEEKEDLVKRIVAQDLQMMELIERFKSGLIKELTTIRAGRKALQSYQSGAQGLVERVKNEA